MKKCRLCGAENFEFYASDPHRCKPCIRARARANRVAKIEAYRAWDRQRYYSNPDRRESAADCMKRARADGRATAYNREWRQRNREKVAAHNAVAYAIRHGRLVRQPCACGNPDSHAHHADYSKPLEVTWLCSVCHGFEHRELRAAERTELYDSR